MKYLLKQNLYILTTRFRPKIMLYKRCARSQQAPGASLFSILLSHTWLLLPPNTAVP